ncbi:hypothetical protein GmHk_U059995 [Glycine max]|nr:hypothetical protein GmHk_U059995 [Glycine max]
MNIGTITLVKTALVSNATFAKPLPNVSKNKEHVDTLLDLHGVAFALTSKKPNSKTPTKELE